MAAASFAKSQCGVSAAGHPAGARFGKQTDGSEIGDGGHDGGEDQQHCRGFDEYLDLRAGGGGRDEENPSDFRMNLLFGEFT